MYISNENCIHVVVVCRTFQNKHRCLPIVFLKKNSDSSKTKREKRTDAASNQNKTGNSCI